MEAENNTPKINQTVPDKQSKWSIQMLSVKEDIAMTRVYSAISSHNLIMHPDHSVKKDTNTYNS